MEEIVGIVSEDSRISSRKKMGVYQEVIHKGFKKMQRCSHIVFNFWSIYIVNIRYSTKCNSIYLVGELSCTMTIAGNIYSLDVELL